MDKDDTIDISDREPLYFISIAAKLVGMHAQTLRKYERMGLIDPPRSGGNIRLYSTGDIQRLRQIKYLVTETGINLAGIDRILEISEVVLRMERSLRRESDAGKLRRALAEEIDNLQRLLGLS